MEESQRIGYETGLRAAVLTGDEAAWRAWYDAHADGLHRYVMWRCGNLAELADDVVQEVWLTAVRRIADFKPQTGGFRQWLNGIAALTLKNHLRKRQRIQVRQQVLVEVPAASNSPDDDDRAWRTAKALSEMPPRYERVLRAKYLDGCSVNDIAHDWNESPKAVESVLTRAREQFRNAYERLGRADG
jgi:RNA polymerase sigma-70 factor (ECF subfamily)